MYITCKPDVEYMVWVITTRGCLIQSMVWLPIYLKSLSDIPTTNTRWGMYAITDVAADASFL